MWVFRPISLPGAVTSCSLVTAERVETHRKGQEPLAFPISGHIKLSCQRTFLCGVRCCCYFVSQCKSMPLIDSCTKRLISNLIWGQLIWISDRRRQWYFPRFPSKFTLWAIAAPSLVTSCALVLLVMQVATPRDVTHRFLQAAILRPWAQHLGQRHSFLEPGVL